MNIALWLACCSSLCLKPSPWLMEKARRDLGWLPAACHQRSIGGFTLAELLISLAILGVIATFTIPKIMAGQQNSQYNAEAHDTIGMISQAFQMAQRDGLINANTTQGALTPYMNYVRFETTGSIDHNYGFGSINCVSGSFIGCLSLHNGGRLLVDNSSFGGTSATNALSFYFDPDGKVTDGTTNGPGKSIIFQIYYNGQVVTNGTRDKVYCANWGCGGVVLGTDAPWFSW